MPTERLLDVDCQVSFAWLKRRQVQHRAGWQEQVVRGIELWAKVKASAWGMWEIKMR